MQTFDHLDKAETRPVDRVVGDASVDDYDALVLPGGVANPDALRMDEAAVAFVRDFAASGKPVAAICHAPWTLVEADTLRGKRLDVVAQPADRHRQRRRRVGRRGGRRRRQPDHQPQPRRHPGVHQGAARRRRLSRGSRGGGSSPAPAPRIRGMSDFPLYALSEEHQAIREAVRAVCDAKVAPFAADVDEQARYPREAADALRAADFHAPHVPEEYGGAGADALATCLVIEEVARACVSSSLIPAVNKLGSLPVQIAGSEELKKHYLGKLAARRGRLLVLPLRARRRLRRGRR